MPRRLVLAAVVLLALPTVMHAVLEQPKGSAQVADPCGLPLPSGTACLPASITDPSPMQVIKVGTTEASFRFKIVAEIDRPVYAYFLREDDTLYNTLPYVRQSSGDTGLAVLDLSLVSLPPGVYRLAAFYLASHGDPNKDESFYQLTGSPVVTFIAEAPPLPPRPRPPYTPPPDTPDEPLLDCEMREIFEVGGITYGRRKDGTGRGAGGTLYVMTRLDATKLASRDAARTALMDAALTTMAAEACGHITADPPIPHGMAVTKVLDDHGFLYSGFGAYTDSQLLMTRAQITARVTSRSASCDPPPVAQVLPGTSIVNIFVNRETFSTNPADPCSECDGWRICYTSGNSPLLFFSSDRPVDARVDVAPRGGRVSESQPQIGPLGWDVTVRPDATTRPLYYEFTAPLPTLPATGWSVPGHETEAFLRELLTGWGYPLAEVEAFIAADVRPRIGSAPYIEVRLFDRADVDALLPLSISPTPDHVERLLFHLTASDAPRSFTPPDAVRYVPSPGFSVRELGAVVAPTAR